MEILLINIVKSSALIAIFYIAYFLLLRKETFFTTNRWFLLAGLLTSAILPWIVITNIVWVEQAPAINWTKMPMTKSEEPTMEVNWNSILFLAYALGSLLLLIQFILDYFNLKRIIKSKTSILLADQKFIDHRDTIAPFSYFNTIVYNSSLYNEQELQSILEHEKVHSQQYHTIDVLITRIYCILFWFNPFIWLYKQAIMQNLEFIADQKASEKLADRRAYQLTLLKITTHQNGVSLSNHFYQSLIKKRIVMLNKNQSKKWNSLKYAVIIPVLGAFMFLYQMQVIAKEKHQEFSIQKNTSQKLDIYSINKSSTASELKEKAETIKKNHGLDVRFSKTKRNANNELTAISVVVKKGNEISENRTIKSNEPIKSFAIVVSENENGKISISFNETNNKLGTHSKTIVLSESVPSADRQIIIETNKDINENVLQEETISAIQTDILNDDPKKAVRMIIQKNSDGQTEQQFFINGEKVDKATFDNDKPSPLNNMGNNKEGKKTIKIITKSNFNINSDMDAPVPPSPPSPPSLNSPKTIAPPALPKAPKGDPLSGDKKAWEDFEKKMEDYHIKMQLKTGQMQAYQKQMADYEKQMEPFKKEMQVYQEKMKIYAKELKKHLMEKKAFLLDDQI